MFTHAGLFRFGLDLYGTVKLNPNIRTRPLVWLQPGDSFPPVNEAQGVNEPAPGLLAAGGSLDVGTLLSAYSLGIFPWFSDGQPPLWWSTDPRMVLRIKDFKLHPSLKKELRSLLRANQLDIRFNNDFRSTISACATSPRQGQDGTWIVQEMQEAYLRLHNAGHAHSVEVWENGTMCGGLYVVCVGRMIYGESMFSRKTNASKLALCALVAFCLAHDIPMIDCQQQTRHLASLGAAPWPRDVFTQHLQRLTQQAPAPWGFDPIYWTQLFNRSIGSA